MDNTNVFVDTGKRIIYLSDEINQESVGMINFNILSFNQGDDELELKEIGYERKPIQFYINSNGGYIRDMWGLIDLMLESKTPIHTYCSGYAYSAAFDIFLAGSKRYITKHVSLMYHQLYTCHEGRYQDFIEYKDELNNVQNELEEYVTEHSRVSKERLEEIRSKKIDWYISAEEALKLGIATDYMY